MMKFSRICMISHREFLCRVRRKSYVLAATLVPLMTAVAFYLPLAFVAPGSAGTTGMESLSTLATGMVFVVFIMMSGGMVMSSVAEEKSGKIAEVLLTSAGSGEIVLGKIAGTLAAALLQMALWVALSAVITLCAGGGAEGFSILSGLFASPAVLILDVLYFAAGCLLYAAVFAVIGSTVRQEGDAQPFQAVVNLPLLIGYVASIYGVNFPDSGFFYWCSFIPFTSPVTMPSRIAGGVCGAEVAASLGILMLTAAALVAFSAGTYRRGMMTPGRALPLLLLLILFSCSGPSSWKSVDMDGSVTPGKDGTAPLVAAIVEDYASRMGGSAVIGRCEGGLELGEPESPMSNWAADMLLDASGWIFGEKADVSLINMGGIRWGMPAGDVTESDIRTIFPFDDNVVLVRLSGKSLRTLCRDLVERNSPQAIGGMRVRARDGKLLEVTVAGAPLSDEGLYSLVSIDFLMDGGDQISLEDFALEVKASDTGIFEAAKREVETGFDMEKNCDGRFALK